MQTATPMANDQTFNLRLDEKDRRRLDQLCEHFSAPTATVVRMLIKAKRPAVSARLQRPVKIVSAVFLALVIAAAVIKERHSIVGSFQQVGLAALVFNLSSMTIGYLVPMIVRLPRRQAIAIAMEIGIHNGTLAIAVASSPLLLNNTTMAIPPAIYSLIMFFTAAGFGWLVSRRIRREAATGASELRG